MSSNDGKSAPNESENADQSGGAVMNVWQTLEVIVGNNLRKKLHYDGYSDVHNLLKFFSTTTRRRDSFVEKITPDEPSKNNDVAKSSSNTGGNGYSGLSNFLMGKPPLPATNKKRMNKRKMCNKKLSKKTSKESSPQPFTDLVECSFNLPRISELLERLMGTNVVRLTDREYMKELRKRIEENYQQRMQKRIALREIKELERERDLILDGKTNEIPPYLANHPIFKVNQEAAVVIAKRRLKLKTSRVKNAERLPRLGAKWEKEREIYEEQERLKQLKIANRKKEESLLQAKYKKEDSRNGLNLLRIHSDEWRECEIPLRDFLKSERKRMKERSLKVPTAYNSDPKDIANIIRARKRFRAEARKLRKYQNKESKSEELNLVKVTPVKVTPKNITEDVFIFEDDLLSVEEVADDNQGSFTDSEIESIVSYTMAAHETRSANILQLNKEIVEETVKGMLVTKETQNGMSYEDTRIVRLRNAATIKLLYQIAEEIIIGEKMTSEEEDTGEEDLGEENNEEDLIVEEELT